MITHLYFFELSACPFSSPEFSWTSLPSFLDKQITKDVTACKITRMSQVYTRAKWLIRLALISSFRSMKRLGIFLLPIVGLPPASNSLVTICMHGWGECLTQKYNTMSVPRTWTRTDCSGVECTIHEDTMPPIIVQIWPNGNMLSNSDKWVWGWLIDWSIDLSINPSINAYVIQWLIHLCH